MKEVFKIAEFNQDGTIKLLEGDYGDYEGAKIQLQTFPIGYYQIQKVFKKYED